MKKITKAIALIFVVAAVVFVAGCAQKTATPVNETITPGNGTVTPGNGTMEKGQVITGIDSGKTISLKNGESFKLSLMQNPSTTFSWKLNVSQGLSILSDSFQNPAPSANMGAAGTRTWVIQAVAPGSQQVNGINKAPGENLSGMEENFTLTVKVI
jgi:inhibitor of cysteine peptidase